jgi:hypothetical protein
MHLQDNLSKLFNSGYHLQLLRKSYIPGIRVYSEIRVFTKNIQYLIYR